MRPLLVMLRQFKKQTPALIEVRIRRGALERNYEHYGQFGAQVGPVLKSNAYGHGLVEVARVLEEKRPPFFAVDSYFEARLLRREGIGTPLLVVGYTPSEVVARNYLRDVSFVLTSLDGIGALARAGSRARVHIKLDTGMRRQGVLPQESAQAIALLKGSALKVDGICSHFASADSDPEFTRMQIAAWNALAREWGSAFALRYKHIAATTGAVRSVECDANLIRIGKGLYGVDEGEPVLSMHSMLTLTKEIAPGDRVGYDGTFVATERMRLGVVPAGYFEGVDRQLSNCGSMLVEGTDCPIVGLVSMNMSTLDVSGCAHARLGSPVTIISADRAAPNTLERLSRSAGMSPLEFSVHIPQHLRRVIV